MNFIDPEWSAARLAQIISCDHGLTCKVLRVANSVAYSPQQTITSVAHAVSWLGLDAVRSLAAAAHLVEQLQHRPECYSLVRTVLARSLLAATFAGELGAAAGYSQPSLLHTSALLYSIGDLALAYEAPELYKALQANSKKARTVDERRREEIRLIGVPLLTLAQALAQMWKLPGCLVDLFGFQQNLPAGRWGYGHQTYQGIVIGSTRLVDASTVGGLGTSAEEIKRALLMGIGIHAGHFGDLMIRARNRGLQLIRSLGLAIDLSDEDASPLSEVVTSDSLSRKISGQPATRSQVRPSSPCPPIQARPLETLQTFQESLQQAKDLNNLLMTFVQALHHDAGFNRVGLALLSTEDVDSLDGRFVLGPTSPSPYLRALSGSLMSEHRLFLTVLKRNEPLFVSELTAETRALMKREFLEIWKPSSAILFPLRIGAKPIGLVYCDRGPSHPPLPPQDYQTCQLLFMPTTLGMNRLAGVL